MWPAHKGFPYTLGFGSLRLRCNPSPPRSRDMQDHRSLYRSPCRFAHCPCRWAPDKYCRRIRHSHSPRPAHRPIHPRSPNIQHHRNPHPFPHRSLLNPNSSTHIDWCPYRTPRSPQGCIAHPQYMPRRCHRLCRHQPRPRMPYPRACSSLRIAH